MASSKKKKPLTIQDVASMGGKARAEQYSAEELSRMAKKASRKGVASRAACTHPETERRKSRKTGKWLPDTYCKRCRRKIT